MSLVVVCISGHGFGHAVRVSEVLRELAALRPETRFAVRTAVPEWFLAPLLPPGTPVVTDHLDVGVVQRDSLHGDLGATLESCRELLDRAPAIVEQACDDLAPLRPSLLLADIPFLAFDIAARLRVPGVGLGNFSWDWIYADYAGEEPAFARIAGAVRRSYGLATLFLELPFAGDLTAFPRRRRVPLIARRARLGRDEVRSRLGLPREQRLLLVSFGGIGIALPPHPSLPVDVVPVVTPSDGAAAAIAPPYRAVTPSMLRDAGLGHADLLAACDAVLSKPGYGIVAECVANRVPLIYTARGRFAEYPVLEAAVRDYLPHRFLAREAAVEGRWAEALASPLIPPRIGTPPPCDGAREAARILAEFLR